MTSCRRGGRAGAACCHKPEKEDRGCPCKCRRGSKAKRIARVECMKRRGLCAVKTCGNRKRSTKWQCCGRRGGKRGNGDDDDDDNDGDKDGKDDGDRDEDD